MNKISHQSKSPEDTKALARKLLQEASFQICFLKGELGSGKTLFVKAVAEALGENPIKVKSPTFTFMNEYEDFVHYDLYRMKKLDVYLLDQIQEQLSHGLKIFIEWPELLEGLFPDSKVLQLHFKHQEGNERLIELILPL